MGIFKCLQSLRHSSRSYTKNDSKVGFWLRWLCSTFFVFTRDCSVHNGRSLQTKNLRSRLAKFLAFESFSVYRLFQWLIVTGIVTIIIGMSFFSKKSILKEQAFSCFKDNQVVLFFYASKALTPRISLPVNPIQTLEDLPFLDVDVQGTKWKMAALRTFSVGDLMAELSMNHARKYPFPLIVLVQDLLGVEYLIVCNEEMQISLSSMKHLFEYYKIDRKNENLINVMISDSRQKDMEPISLCIVQSTVP